MSRASRYRNIPKEEFEKVLKSVSLFAEFPDYYYLFDWIMGDGEMVKVDGVIKEYCYFIPVDSDYEIALKIYSGIERKTGTSRERGEDAIRFVVARHPKAEPIRPPFPIVKRIQTWQENFKIRVSEALESLGLNTICKCGARMYLWRNTEEKNKGKNIRFLSCSKRCGEKTRTFAPTLADLRI